MTDASSENDSKRELARRCFEFAIEAFGRLVDPPMSTAGRNHPIQWLLKNIDNDSAKDFQTIFMQLQTLFTQSPESVFLGRQSEARYLADYVDDGAIREMAGFIESIFVKSNLVTETNPNSKVIYDFLAEWLRRIASELHFSVENGPPFNNEYYTGNISEKGALTRWRDALDNIRISLDEMFDLRNATNAAKQAAAETIDALEAAKMAAGQLGALSLGSHFHDISKEESSSARWYTISVFALLAAIVVIAIVVFKRADSANWIETLLHLSITLPLIAGASYAARVARHHRELARWAKTASVQLNSISAYSLNLKTESARDELMKTLGLAVFSAPSFSEDSRSDHVSVISPELLETLKALAERLPAVAKEIKNP